jgi:hypothetical protein
MIVIWLVGALLVGGLLYFALPLLTVTLLFALRVLFYVVVACLGIRLMMFLAFLVTRCFDST